MAFPDEVVIPVQAVDPSSTLDIQNIQSYQTLLSNGDFTTAAQFIQSMENGINMLMNAGRYNELRDIVVQIQTFYLGLDGVKAYITENIDKYTDVNVWNNTTNYSIGNISSEDGNWYICIQINGPSSSIVEPNVTSGWEGYWSLFLTPMPAKQYPIQSEQPTGQSINDLWFEVIE